MKKLLAVSLAVILVFSLGFTTFANGFVQSPSNNSAPVVDEAETKNETAGCTAEIEITPYSDRDELPAELKKQMEDVYKKISEATDVSALSTELKSFCDKNKINTKDLAVSDLFDIAYEGCTAHDGHGQFTITLKAETLKNFVALLHYDGSKFELVEGAKVSADGTKLTFKIDDFSPFAIVVNTKGTSTGDTFNLGLWIAILSASVVALAAVAFIGFKRKKA